MNINYKRYKLICLLNTSPHHFHSAIEWLLAPNPATGNKLVVLLLSSLDPGARSIQIHSHTILIRTITTVATTIEYWWGCLRVILGPFKANSSPFRGPIASY